MQYRHMEDADIAKNGLPIPHRMRNYRQEVANLGTPCFQRVKYVGFFRITRGESGMESHPLESAVTKNFFCIGYCVKHSLRFTGYGAADPR